MTKEQMMVQILFMAMFLTLDANPSLSCLPIIPYKNYNEGAASIEAMEYAYRHFQYISELSSNDFVAWNKMTKRNFFQGRASIEKAEFFSPFIFFNSMQKVDLQHLKSAYKEKELIFFNEYNGNPDTGLVSWNTDSNLVEGNGNRTGVAFKDGFKFIPIKELFLVDDEDIYGCSFFSAFNSCHRFVNSAKIPSSVSQKLNGIRLSNSKITQRKRSTQPLDMDFLIEHGNTSFEFMEFTHQELRKLFLRENALYEDYFSNPQKVSKQDVVFAIRRQLKSPPYGLPRSAWEMLKKRAPYGSIFYYRSECGMLTLSFRKIPLYIDEGFFIRRTSDGKKFYAPVHRWFYTSPSAK